MIARFVCFYLPGKDTMFSIGLHGAVIGKQELTVEQKVLITMTSCTLYTQNPWDASYFITHVTELTIKVKH